MIKFPKNHTLKIEHNGHKHYYLGLQGYLELPKFSGKITPADRAKIIELDEMWECHIYPNIPPVYYYIIVPTWERLVEEFNKLKLGKNE